jgi:ectoine hydroxylase-related dioxygenase (phytanoyl-CoA dioxygenase family)/protein-L-isoaspartate O-methyltransferase
VLEDRTRAMAEEDDCWDAFGSDDESDAGIGGGAGGKDATAVALHLSLFFLKQNAQVHLPERRVGLVAEDPDLARTILEQREMTVVQDDLATSRNFFLDAIVVMNPVDHVEEQLLERLVPGGMLVTHGSVSASEKTFEETSTIYEADGICLVGRVKKSIRGHIYICPWLPSSHSKTEEEERLKQATVALSSHEISRSQMVDSSIQRAVECMNKYGYCIVRNLLNQDECKEWGDTVLESVHAAAKILLERDQVDIYHPQSSQSEPQSYRELSMREDLRLDLRHGPELADLRSKGEKGNEPFIVGASTKEFNGFLRGHGSILDIIRRTMNPKRQDLYKGNIGRYNFEGTGADGSFQDLRVSPVGGIVSFPGAAEQAMHADTPHLFEHLPDLPAHYINIFTPGVPFDEKVGGTAFCHGSHNLEFTAKYCGSDDDNTKVYPFLVRPCLTLGDVILFDCRILHFGLANTSKSIERVLLYTNTTHAWFHDPKNWDDRKPIFES